jgi:hypothetical protein
MEKKKEKRKKTGGRRAGTPNKVNATVKMMVLGALAAKGGQKWLKKQMDAEPVAFMTLLGKIMPTQVVGDVSHRFVARIPAPAENPDEWLKTYAPPPLTAKTH